MKTLNVYLNNQLAGILTKSGRSLYFSYVKDANVPISMSLPITDLRYSSKSVRPFFDNLLPEGDLLTIIAQTYKVSKADAFALFSYIGEDTAGAIQITKDMPADITGTKTMIDLTDLLSDQKKKGVFYQKGMRLSVAGVQSKTTLIIDKENYYLPNFSNPSTHIIKFEPSNNYFPDLLLNEYFLTCLSKRIGLSSSDISYETLAGISYLQIARFDRIITETKRMRVHQEDFCQILGFLPTQKYQSDGGPSFQMIAKAIMKYSHQSALDLIKLSKILVFNYLTGNCDYHAKNLAMFSNEKPHLTPFYDLVSTRVYDLDQTMAMSINRKFDIEEITKADIIKELDQFGIDGTKILSLILSDYKNILLEINSLLSIEPFLNNTTIQNIALYIKIKWHNLLAQ